MSDTPDLDKAREAAQAKFPFLGTASWLHLAKWALSQRAEEAELCSQIAAGHEEHGEFVHGGRSECAHEIARELKKVRAADLRRQAGEIK